MEQIVSIIVIFNSTDKKISLKNYYKKKLNQIIAKFYTYNQLLLKQSFYCSCQIKLLEHEFYLHDL